MSVTVPRAGEQREVARLLVSCILDGRSGAMVELRAIDHDGQVRQHWSSDVNEFITVAMNVSEEMDTYVGALPRFARSGCRGALLDGNRMLWADADTAAAVVALDRFPVAPTFRVESGGLDSGVPKLHGWWVLRQRLTLAAVEHVNRRLALALGSDPSVHDASRILRLPGTTYWKATPPGQVRCTAVGDDADVRELVRALPELPPERPAPAPVRLHAASPLNAIHPAEYVERLTGRVVGRDGKVGCPFHAGGRERTPSLHVYDEPERGWYCFACRVGGDVFNFAGLLWGLDPRAEFPELRERLVAALGLEGVVAA